ncbi:hypothetical protein CATRI_01940 [Corynebacterium atrinae]|uniref:hypothetical protein n=1 Tax=Corynebacterium atrinae TaxID=1336740 RepID=UPI0025B52586|nr:hypothetical protein [Corynebacterium atrinae]WJY62493.1 hypothetical protein CATRI_01940 [Corynebacterium atrinae]
MNPRIALVDRILVFLLGVVIVLGGLWAIGLFFNVPLAQGLADNINFAAWRSAPDQRWFNAVLTLILVFSAAFGGWLIALNLRRYRVSRVYSPSSSPAGDIEINLATLATAIAHELEADSRIDSVDHVVSRNFGQTIMTLTVWTTPSVDMAELSSHLRSTEGDLRAALPGIDVITRYRVHLRPPR